MDAVFIQNVLTYAAPTNFNLRYGSASEFTVSSTWPKKIPAAAKPRSKFIVNARLVHACLHSDIFEIQTPIAVAMVMTIPRFIGFGISLIEFLCIGRRSHVPITVDPGTPHDSNSESR